VLALSELGQELAPRILREEIARIEVVHCRRAGDERREISRKVGDVRAAPVPERVTLGDGVEEQDFFHAAVTVRCDDDDALTRAEHDVVVELTLRPVREHLERAMPHP